MAQKFFTMSFDFPDDPLKYQPTVWMIEKNLLDLADQFLESEPDEDQLFYVWGHGNELDFGTRRCNWYCFEKFCDRIAGRKDILYCDNKTAFRMHEEQKRRISEVENEKSDADQK
ncbi:hypothetical protein AALC16_14390 [Lachnospiraceae bacterium 29-91]